MRWPWRMKDPIDRWLTYVSLALILLSAVSWLVPALGTPVLWALLIYLPFALANTVRGLIQMRRERRKLDESLRQFREALRSAGYPEE